MRRLTKKLEAEILKAYYTYWDAYLKGDMKTFASFLDDSIITYGTAGGEIFNSKKEAIKFYKATADQMTGKADFRKRKISAKAVGDTIVVNEQSDLYVLDDGSWTFYGHSRITAIFEQKGNTWKLVHQHASFPDSRTEEGEQIATKKIKKENLELREAVRRRTIELEEKNRELEIETALEKVRAVAMGMKERADMLKICKTISLQLAGLGVKDIRNVQTAIFNVLAGTYMNYEYYAKHRKAFITETLYTNHKVARAFAAKMLKGKGEVSITHIRGKEKVKEWLKYQKGTNVFIDTYLNAATSLSYYWFSLGPVALGISTYLPLSKEELQLFQRFLKVFELAYRRYLDIEKAEAQAREAQIEAALERIRARALAMHSSDEFTDVARVMREQMGQLGQQEMETSAVHLYDEDAEYILSWRAFRLSSDLKSKINYGFFKIPKNSCKIAREFVQKFKSKASEYTIEISGAMQTEWYKILFKLAPEVQAAMKKSGTTKEKRYYHFSKFSGGSLLMVSSKEPSNNAIELQKRAAQVFDLAYSRFKDLQKAEAQAREAQVEAALERIRAASLAMQDSSALGEIIYKLYGELTKLDAQLDRCFIMIVNPDNRGITWWMAGHEGLLAENGFFVPMNQHPSHLMYLDYCKKRKKKWTYLFEGKEKRDWDRFGFTKTELAKLPEPIKAFMAAAKKVHLSGSSDQFGSLVTGSFEPLPDEQQEIISRFAVVFNQAYIRFLDLQKAEVQAREAQIEAALEKVRSRSMAMQQPEELIEVAELLRREMGLLGVEELETSSIYIIDNEKKKAECWYAIKDVRKENAQLIGDEMTLTLTDTWVGKEMWKFYQSANDRISILMKGERRREWINYCAEHSKVLQGYYGDEIPERTYHLVKFYGGYMGAASPGTISKESWDLLKRAAVVFSLAYTRFNDLQDAAARAREAQIELALERVRARSLAMHKSEELKEVIKVVLEQFVHLHINAEHAGFYIDYKTHDDMHIWLADPNLEPFYAVIPYFDTPTWNSFLEAKAKGTTLHTDLLDFKEKNKFYKKLFKLFVIPEDAQKFYLQCKGLAVSTALLDNVGLYIENFSAIPYTNEENNILIRFGNVFQQTYTRFLDLQKAEAQARDAQIEAALERVRAKAMAMHSTNELKEVVHELRKQMGLLGQKRLETCVIHLHDESEEFIQSWAGINPPDKQGEIVESIANVPKKGLMIIEEALGAYAANKQEYIIINKGEKLKQWFAFLEKEVPDAFTILSDSVQGNIEQLEAFWSFADFAGGSLLMVTLDEPDEPTRVLLRRFSNVFGLAYRRFVDLKQAEAQAREAKIEAALEKVRSRTLAMQKSDELAETAAVLFQQLIVLGIAPNRLFIILIKEDTPEMEAWLTDEDGSKVNMGFTGNYTKNESLNKMYEGWLGKKKSLLIDMQGDELQKYFHYLHDELNVPFKGGLEQKRRIQHLAYFNHGLIGMASPDEQPAETMQLLERFAAVFNLTFTRFNDLKLAEAHALQAEQDLIAIKEAKQKAEAALKELQATQKQLIQIEKMASLGELTAGIAHEIQNPLNFVNNFSEVSKELLEEMKDAVEKGNVEDAKEIMNDVIQNLEKINHHGKRADGIVKGMLQHSRSGTGKKELTDINALCDEYLRLAFHGLRAKEKSFNAKFETSLDETVGKINVMPQDIGRVILNLINNAFYAVSERKKNGETSYDPTVIVTTKKEGGKVLISVKDNGTGIPQKVQDKIFQPFFTTKPTGQGTGLGLSLSYDIVTKGHGGELEVETKEGEGTIFKIILPA